MRFLLVALCFVSAAANAQQWYGYGGVSSIREGGSSAAVGAGYQFTRFAAAELGLFTPSDVTNEVTPTGPTTNTTVTRSLKGFTLTGIGSLPLGGSFTLFASAGAYYLHGKFESRTTRAGGAPDVVDNGSSTGFSPAFGVGALYRFNEVLGLRATWEQINLKSGLFGSGHDLDRLHRASIALQFYLK